MSAVVLRLLGEGDAEAWQAMRIQRLKTDPDAFGATLEETVAMSAAEVAGRLSPTASEHVPNFGAFDGGVMVGMCGLKRDNRLKERHKAVLWGMYVDPAARGRGVGQVLLVAAIAHARTMPDVVQVTLSVVASNAGAVTLYRRHGFSDYGFERRALRYQGIDFDEHHMVLFLDDSNPVPATAPMS